MWHQLFALVRAALAAHARAAADPKACACMPPIERASELGRILYGDADGAADGSAGCADTASEWRGVREFVEFVGFAESGGLRYVPDAATFTEERARQAFHALGHELEGRDRVQLCNKLQRLVDSTADADCPRLAEAAIAVVEAAICAVEARPCRVHLQPPALR